MAPPKKQQQAKRCPVDGCKVRLEGTSANTRCGKCGLAVCNNHIFPSDHVCVPKAATAPAGVKMELVVEKKTAPAASDAFPALQIKVNSSKSASDTANNAPAPSAVVDEENDVPEILTLEDQTSEQLSSEFIVTVQKKRLGRLSEAGSLVRALNALAHDSKLGPQISEQARSAIGRATSSPQKSDILASLEGAVFEVDPARVKPGTWIAYAMFISRASDSDETFYNALERIVIALAKIKEPNTWFGIVLSEALRTRRMDCDPSLAENALLGNIVAKLFSKFKQTPVPSSDVLRSSALLLAGIADGMGGPQAIHDLKLISETPDSGILFILQALAEVCGRSLEPFVWKWRKAVGDSLLTKYTKSDADTRARALAAGQAICKYVLGPLGTEEWVESLIKNSRDPSSWREKEYSLDLLQVLIVNKVDLLHESLPTIVLAMAAAAVDAKKEVASKASLGLDSIGESVTNPETKRLMPFILDAIKRPDAGTDKCLSELMDATFVNSLNATSVALIIPVVTRALREGSSDLKRRGATATGNVCALVRDLEDVRRFEKSIKTELLKLKDHSSPEVRKAAEKALESLNKALGNADSSKQPKSSGQLKKDNDVLAGECVEELKESLFYTPGVMTFAQSNMKSLMALLMSLPAIDVSVERVEREVASHFGYFSPREVSAVTESLLSRVKRSRADSFENAELEQADKDEILVDIKDMILAYASRVLLSKTRITLKRGHRYGIVGKIGVGKTTLASRLAKGDLENFPPNVSTYMILHEVLQEDMSKTVHEYMGGTDIAQETLRKVGFADPKVLVSTLSGGWRMRLAIAKSMLANADLIVLDEPTNHVDVNGVAWLAQYLRSLEEIGTTCVIVSHDYDFLSEVATDILHINNQRLDAFEGGFDNFQKAYPEIAAALPKMNAPTPVPSRGNTPGMAGETASETDVSREPTPAPEASGDGGMAIFDLLSQQDPQAVAELLASRSIPVITFPDPGKLEGITSKGKPIMSATNVTFSYPSNPEKIILRDVSCKLSLNSRIALRGANGQGKSTLMKLLVGELGMNEASSGTVWKHHNLRVAYVAQHAIHHLLEHLDITPIQYLQRRYYEGRDKERGEMVTLALDENDKKVMSERGEICGILSRVTRGKQLYYEIEVTGRRKVGEGGDGRVSRSQKLDDSSGAKEFRSLAQLEVMNKPHVIKLIKMFDEELKYEASGLALRPTNFLDAETLAVLTHSLRAFKGAVLTVSHHEAFVRVLCNEAWDMDQGKLTITILKEKMKVGGAIAAAAKAAAAATAAESEDQ